MSSEEQNKKLEKIKNLMIQKREAKRQIAKREEQLKRKKEEEFIITQKRVRKVLNKLPRNETFTVKVTHPLTKDVTQIQITNGFITGYESKYENKFFNLSMDKTNTSRFDRQGFIFELDPHEIKLYQALEHSIDFVLDQITEQLKKWE